MPLFVVLREGAELDDELRREIARRIREHCSPRHVPDEVFQIAEVPRTLSGKVLEVPVKRILMGTPRGEGGQPRLARQPRRARLLRRARRPPGGLRPRRRSGRRDRVAPLREGAVLARRRRRSGGSARRAGPSGSTTASTTSSEARWRMSMSSAYSSRFSATKRSRSASSSIAWIWL